MKKERRKALSVFSNLFFLLFLFLIPNPLSYIKLLLFFFSKKKKGKGLVWEMGKGF